MLVILKHDNYNFTLGTKLDDPRIFNINGKEVIQEYKKKNLYYGTLYEAIRGLCRHSGINYFEIPLELKNIKPYSNDDLFISFLNRGVEQIRQNIKKE